MKRVGNFSLSIAYIGGGKEGVYVLGRGERMVGSRQHLSCDRFYPDKSQGWVDID